MAKRSTGRRSWLRYGLLGCAGIAVVVLLVVGGIVATAWMQIQSESVEARELFPAPEMPAPVEETRARLLDTLAPGRVILDIEVASLVIEAAAPGEPIRVETEYDPRRYRLDQAYEGSEPTGWIYRVVFEPRGSRNLAVLRMKLGAAPPELRLFLPRGVPLLLEGTLSVTFGAIEANGLYLRTVDLELRQGALDLSVWEPLPQPMERLVLRSRSGMVKVARMGNASPAHVEIEQEFGAIDLDLRGDWVRDADLSIDVHVAGGTIRLPRGVTIEGLDPLPRRPPGHVELPPPTLRFSVSSRVGDLLVVD